MSHRDIALDAVTLQGQIELKNHAVGRGYFAGKLVADQFPVGQRPLLTFVRVRLNR